jgi:hypothetical protein
VIDAEVVDESQDTTALWVDAINGAGDRGQLMAVWEDAKGKGAHQTPAIREAFAQRGQALKDAA